MRAVRGLLLAVVALATAIDAGAHDRSVSYSSWEIDGTNARVTLRMSALELTRLGADPFAPDFPDATLTRYLTGRLQLRSRGAACPVTEAPIALAAPPGKIAFEWRIGCASDPDTVYSRLFQDVAPGHLHFARLRIPGRGLSERVLSGASEWRLQADGADGGAPAAGSSLVSYIALGVEHIATGYDHLAFLLALLLLASRLSEVATIVTGFTIGHSITLALAVVGRLRPEAQAVEALIGLSIALVATENAWLMSGRGVRLPAAVAAVLLGMTGLALAGFGALSAAIPAGLIVFTLCYFAILSRVRSPVRWRVSIAFVFGLVHGFGFAGVLEEVSLPTARLAQALLGFNVGVEVGQLAAIALLWPALRLLSQWRGGIMERGIIEVASAAVCAAGVFWLVTRAYT